MMRTLILIAIAVLAVGLATYMTQGTPRLLVSAPEQQSEQQTGPTADRVAALQGQLDGASEEQVQGTIEGMVANLRFRLEDEGGSAEEWDRLVRSYATLQDIDGLRFALNGLLAIEPENAQALLLAGQAASQDGDRSAAKGFFQRLLPLIDPEHPRFEQIKALIEGYDEPLNQSE